MDKNTQHYAGEPVLNILAICTGLVSAISFRCLGILNAAELLAVLNIFLLIGFHRRLSGFGTLFFYATVWIIGACISNLYNTTPVTDICKGLGSKIIFLLDMMLFYVLFSSHPHRILLFLAGSAVSSVIILIFPQLDAYAQDMIKTGETLEQYHAVWKVYLIHPAALAAAAILYYCNFRVTSRIFILLFGIYALFANSRHLFLCWCTVFFLFFIFQNQGLAAKRKILLLGLAISLLLIAESYRYLAENRFLGNDAYQKYCEQSSSAGGLASGRMDFVISLIASGKNPVWGYGDYARDSRLIRLNFYDQIGLDYRINPNKDPREAYIPGHSYILGAWVYSGICGLIFWLYVGRILIKFGTHCLANDPAMLCINLLLTATFLWDYLFSPFGSRVMPAAIICYMFICVRQYYRSPAEQPEHNLSPEWGKP